MTTRHANESIGPAHDPPEYPREWTAAQRNRAYWFVVQHHGSFPTHQSGWYAVLSQSEHRSEHVRDVVVQTQMAIADEAADEVEQRMPYKE